MNLGAISVAALATAIAVSCFSRLNVGLLAIALSWIIGVHLGGMPVKELVAGFPVELFLTLAGVTLLFSQAQVNGTLDRLAHQAVRLCRGRTGVVPIFFFFAGAVLASMGPGNIATAGLLAPMAMNTALRMGISPFLMAIMVGNGANSGSLSPIAPTGLIVGSLMAKIGLGGMEVRTWLYNLLAHALVAFAGYLLFGGWKLLAHGKRIDAVEANAEPLLGGLERRHWMTLAMIAALVLGVIFLKLHIGMAAFAAAVVLSLLGAADDAQAIRSMPWATILMVCGVTVLISLMEKTNGLELFTDLLARTSTRATLVPVLAAITGLISAYSSTSGVVLPALLPTVPGLIARLGGGDMMAIASTMNVAGHLVDVSPLSTIGALCVASIPAGETSRKLFHQLLAWGLSMTLVGAAICYALFG
ncbi:MAG: C4-dicarboxylate ABC transporter [Acidobacteriia bacterium]|nr:C4-dicarboxylate ABC transporter [Terriglobia bacterium]